MIDYQLRGHVAEILLNRPPVNALDDVLMDQLLALIIQKNGLPVIQAQSGSRKITSEDVRRGLED